MRHRRNYMASPRSGRDPAAQFWPINRERAYVALADFFTVALEREVVAEEVEAGAFKDAGEPPYNDYTSRTFEQLLGGGKVEEEHGRKVYGPKMRPTPGFIRRETGSLRAFGESKGLPDYEFYLDYVILQSDPEDSDSDEARRVIRAAVGVPNMFFVTPEANPLPGFRDDLVNPAVAAFFNVMPENAMIYDGYNFDDDEYATTTLVERYGHERELSSGTVTTFAQWGRWKKPGFTPDVGTEVGTYFFVRPYVQDPEGPPGDFMGQEDNVIRVEFGWPQQYIVGGGEKRAMSLYEYALAL